MCASALPGQLCSVQTLPGREGWLAGSVLEVRYTLQEHKSGAGIVTGKGTGGTEDTFYI